DKACGRAFPVPPVNTTRLAVIGFSPPVDRMARAFSDPIQSERERLWCHFAGNAFRRPFHHSVKFQLTQVASARLRPIAEPNCRTAACSTATARPNPIRPQAPLAITAAVGGPP